MSKFMQMAVDTAGNTMREKIGGPFGACITRGSGENEVVVAVTSNSVLGDNDATAHAEVNAIRVAGMTLRTHDLTGCTLYTTCYPCPMCLFACQWANIKTIVYGCSPEDADNVGFRDHFMYDVIMKEKLDSMFNFKKEDTEMCLSLFQDYMSMKGELY